MGLIIDDLEKYREYLENLSKTDSPDIFFNSGSNHAEILMSTLFQKTNNDIKMFCRGLMPELTSRNVYFDAFSNYIERGGHLSLLVETKDYMNERMFRFLLDKLRNGNDRIQIKQIIEKDKCELFKDLKSEHCNFAVFDEKIVRFEYNPDNYLAFGSFNYPDMANFLTNKFNDVFKSATDIN